MEPDDNRGTGSPPLYQNPNFTYEAIKNRDTNTGEEYEYPELALPKNGWSDQKTNVSNKNSYDTSQWYKKQDPEPYTLRWFLTPRWFWRSVPVLVVLVLFGITYFATLDVLFLDTESEPSFQPPLLSIIYHIICILWFISYLRCIFHDPGGIPHEFIQKYEKETALAEISAPTEYSSLIERKRDGAFRICHKCSLPKPDRCHHCSSCNRCILKMDHHCPWINNCVGFKNYKFFILFLTYTVLLSLWTSLCIGLRLIESDQFSVSNPAENVIVISAFFLGLIFGIGLMFFNFMHYRLILSNMTTIESFEKWGRLGERAALLNPYDLGTKRRNFEEVFGPSVWLWFLPIYSSQGNGCYFVQSQYGGARPIPRRSNYSSFSTSSSSPPLSTPSSQAYRTSESPYPSQSYQDSPQYQQHYEHLLNTSQNRVPGHPRAAKKNSQPVDSPSSSASSTPTSSSLQSAYHLTTVNQNFQSPEVALKPTQRMKPTS